MPIITKGPKGTQDLLPKQTYKWQIVEDVMRNEAAVHGFGEIRTPVFEHTELFLRGVGDTTDVVEKQMYTFEDKAHRSITLKPEGTAGVVRSFMESGIYNDGYPVKLYYLTPCYRYEKPQAGRLREFHQFGIEMFGTAEPIADAEIIVFAKNIFDRLGVKNLSLEINSIGCPKCRANYHKALKKYFESYRDQLCDTCNSRLDRNPMRILDCKSPVCSKIAEGAPKIIEFLCDECSEHFSSVKKYLTASGLEYTVNPNIVRGLDYYSRTVFEFVSNDLGAQSTVCGGGRYDGLVEEMGGKPTPGLGFGMGLERLMLVLDAQGIEFPPEESCEVFIASMGADSLVKSFELVNKLRDCGINAACDLCGRGFKAQLKYANKIKASHLIVIGDEEIASGKANLKDMETGKTVKISLVGEKFIDDYVTNITMQEDMPF